MTDAISDAVLTNEWTEMLQHIPQRAIASCGKDGSKENAFRPSRLTDGVET